MSDQAILELAGIVVRGIVCVAAIVAIYKGTR